MFLTTSNLHHSFATIFILVVKFVKTVISKIDYDCMHAQLLL